MRPAPWLPAITIRTPRRCPIFLARKQHHPEIRRIGAQAKCRLAGPAPDPVRRGPDLPCVCYRQQRGHDNYQHAQRKAHIEQQINRSLKPPINRRKNSGQHNPRQLGQPDGHVSLNLAVPQARAKPTVRQPLGRGGGGSSNRNWGIREQRGRRWLGLSLWQRID